MKIKDLPPEKVAEIIRRYYEGDKVSTLIKEFGLDLKPNLFVADLPREQLDVPCRQCGGVMSRARRARGGSAWSRTPPVRCETCSHFDAEAGWSQRCGCATCRDEEQRAIEAQLTEIVGAIDAYIAKCEKPPVRLADLSVRQRIYLAALATACADERLSVLTDVHAARPGQAPIAPRIADITSMVAELWHVGAIGLPVDLSENACHFEDVPGEGSIVTAIYVGQVDWKIRILDLDPNEALAPTCVPTREEAIELWRGMSQSEALAYLEAQRERYGIDGTAGDKTAAVVREMTEYFSTSESYYFVWSSMRDLIAAKQEKNLPRRHVANSLPVFLKTKFEGFRSRNWAQQKPWTRYDKQSLVSQIVYNRVLGLGDRGFSSRPCMENLARPLE